MRFTKEEVKRIAIVMEELGIGYRLREIHQRRDAPKFWCEAIERVPLAYRSAKTRKWPYLRLKRQIEDRLLSLFNQLYIEISSAKYGIKYMARHGKVCVDCGRPLPNLKPCYNCGLWICLQCTRETRLYEKVCEKCSLEMAN